MSDKENEIQHLDEDQVLVYTQSLRKKVINKLMSDGKVPGDIRELDLLKGVLSDMDRTALTSKRIKSDDDNNKANGGGAALIAKLLQSFKTSDIVNTDEVSGNFKSPTVDDSVSLPSLTPGELHQGTATGTFDDFEKIHFNDFSPINKN